MGITNYRKIALAWGNSTNYLQIITRRISVISAAFTLLATFIEPGSFMVWTLGLAAAYITYNAGLCWRQAAPQPSELVINLVLCSGLTALAAPFSGILYHLLLVRMVLKAGRGRAQRVTWTITLFYLATTLVQPGVITVHYVLEMLYNVLGFGVLAYTAVYLHSVMDKQWRHESEIAQLIQEKAKHYQLALTDELTGLFNHRAYQEKTADLSQYVLLVVDIDHFKKFNDTYGHLFGDQVLINIANVIKSNIRSWDRAFRYGGEEFAVVLPGTSLELGIKIAERLRLQVANWDFYHNGQRVSVTISIGLSLKKPAVACREAFQQADSALYRAKRQGRNNVQCSVMPAELSKSQSV